MAKDEPMTRTADPFEAARPPHAEKRPHVFEVHGVSIEDDYAWLKADNWQEVLRDPARQAEFTVALENMAKAMPAAKSVPLPPPGAAAPATAPTAARSDL